jgi:23S rRNA pseudouridine2605 synthase
MPRSIVHSYLNVRVHCKVMRERVQKILARAGIAARRKCEELIAEGRVTVNGKTIGLGDHADADKDDIRVNGERLRKAEKKKYYLVNKPRGVVSTVIDPEGRQTVVQLVPRGARVFPVGRLDRDAEGLVLLTNDGALANLLMHPRYEVPRTYHVTLTREIKREDVEKLRRGVRVWGRRLRLHKVAVHTPVHVEIMIHEGKKHMVKLLFKNLGYRVARLKRTQMGNILLKDLPSGTCRELTSAELGGLVRIAHQAQERARAA